MSVVDLTLTCYNVFSHASRHGYNAYTSLIELNAISAHRKCTSVGQEGTNQDQVGTNLVEIVIDREPLHRKDMLDGETSEEKHEMDGLRRRRRKTRQEIKQAKAAMEAMVETMVDRIIVP